MRVSTTPLRRVATFTALAAIVVAGAGCGGSAGSSATTVTEDSSTVDTSTVDTSTVDTSTETPSPDSTTPAAPDATVMRIVVKDGRAEGGIRRLDVARGDNVRLVVVADTADEVHLHGYDLTAEVAPGQKGQIVFVAKVPGRFEIELEGAGVQIGELEVRP